MADIKGMKTGFVLDKDGNRILPITHMSLIIGNDGQTIFATLEEQKAFIAFIIGSLSIMVTNLKATFIRIVRIVNDKIEIRSLTIETAKSRTKYFSMNSESFTVPPVIAETASFHASSLSKPISAIIALNLIKFNLISSKVSAVISGRVMREYLIK